MVIVGEDHAGTAEGIRLLLKSVGLDSRNFASPTQLLQATFEDACCVILDVRMPEMSGIEVFRQLRARGVVTPVIFMSGYGDLPMAVDALRAGALHFLEKPVDDQKLIDSVLEAAAVDAQRRADAHERRVTEQRLSLLTRREREVAQLYAGGMSSRDIADRLEVSLRTVQTFRTRILDKLEIHNLTALVKLFDT